MTIANAFNLSDANPFLDGLVNKRSLMRPQLNPADAYLLSILQSETVDPSINSPLHKVVSTIWPVIANWANGHLLGVKPSGSFSKGTANLSGTDIDLFVSLSPNVMENLRDVYNKLDRALQNAGYKTRRQNVSLNIAIDGHSVDLVPAKRQNMFSEDHSLYRRKADTWTKTNVSTHAQAVSFSGRTKEIRLLKLWRDQRDLDWPSFYLELAVIRALRLAPFDALAENVSRVFEFLRDDFESSRFVDPANSNNIISDDLSAAEKRRIRIAGAHARNTLFWRDIIV